jgi:Flp pilus assembly pilin Flp
MADAGRGKARRPETMDNRCSVTRAVARKLFRGSEVEGQSMVEYSLIFVLMIIVVFSVLGTLSDTVNQKLFQVIQTLPF